MQNQAKLSLDELRQKLQNPELLIQIAETQLKEAQRKLDNHYKCLVEGIEKQNYHLSTQPLDAAIWYSQLAVLRNLVRDCQKEVYYLRQNTASDLS